MKGSGRCSPPRRRPRVPGTAGGPATARPLCSAPPCRRGGGSEREAAGPGLPAPGRTVPGLGQGDLLAGPGRRGALALLHRHQVADIGQHRLQVRHVPAPAAGLQMEAPPGAAAPEAGGWRRAGDAGGGSSPSARCRRAPPGCACARVCVCTGGGSGRLPALHARGSPPALRALSPRPPRRAGGKPPSAAVPVPAPAGPGRSAPPPAPPLSARPPPPGPWRRPGTRRGPHGSQPTRPPRRRAGRSQRGRGAQRPWAGSAAAGAARRRRRREGLRCGGACKNPDLDSGGAGGVAGDARGDSREGAAAGVCPAPRGSRGARLAPAAGEGLRAACRCPGLESEAPDTGNLYGFSHQEGKHGVLVYLSQTWFGAAVLPGTPPHQPRWHRDGRSPSRPWHSTCRAGVWLRVGHKSSKFISS